MKFLKRSLILILVLCLLLGGVVVYLKQFSSSPQATVERFFDCYGNADINGMVACMEPQAEQMVAGSAGVASALFGAITGVDVDFSALIDAMPLLNDLGLSSAQDISISNAHVVSYTPAFAPGVTEFLIGVLPDLVNVMAKDAVVEFEVAGLDTPIQVEVVFYGSDGWRIPMDSDLFS